jgi:hypothetical protein
MVPRLIRQARSARTFGGNAETPRVPGINIETHDPRIEKMTSRDRFSDVAALAMLGVLVVWYFLPHALGRGLFVGDSDRMSHFFTWLIHLNNGVRNGYLPTWNDHLFGGYSTVGLPYTYYNPLAFVGLLFPPELQNWVAGWTSMLWLWLAGIAAYALIRWSVPSAFYAFVGAALYESSAVLVLKISQNESTFSVTVLTPVILLALLAARPGRLLPCTLATYFAFAYLFSVSFLQEAAYACMLAGLFAAYHLIVRRHWSPLLVAAMGGVPAVLVSFPRLLNVATELRLSNRAASGGFDQAWLSLGAFNAYEVLRLLDDRILGRYFSHALKLGNAINLHEGMVAYVSTYAVVVVVVGVAWYIARTAQGNSLRHSDIPFHILFLVFCLSVPVTRTGYWLMYHLFLKVGFIHARVTTVAMPSLCLLTAMFLNRFASSDDAHARRRVPMLHLAIVIVACALVTAIIEVVSQHFVDTRLPVRRHGYTRVVISVGAELRVLCSILIASALLIAVRLSKQEKWRRLMVPSLGLLAVMQIGVYAKDQTSGDFMKSDGVPYRTPTRLLARSDEFRLPSTTARQGIHDVLQPDLYRTALVCDPTRVSIYCTPYIANVWGLREIGGYISSIPTRISALPWPTPQVGLRSITLGSIDDANWNLLALLNVEYAVEYHPALLTNAIRDGHGPARELRPDDLVIHRNPVPVIPRLFFAANVVVRRSMEEVAGALFPRKTYDAGRSDVRNISYVEGPSSLEGRYGSDGEIRAKFRDQFVDIWLTPSDTPRFLVINERYHPDWRAFVDGVATPVLPTNVFMRGLVVPPRVEGVHLEFRPYSLSRRAVPFYLGGAALLIAVLVFTWRIDRRRGTKDSDWTQGNG